MVTRQQLLAAGFTGEQIARRVRSGGLIPIHPGVYLVGHRAISPLAYECAAILYCAPRALLSHRTAAGLYGLGVTSVDCIDVTIVGRRRRSRRGLNVHFLTELKPVDLRRHHGLPISSPALTLLDFAGESEGDELERALNEARVQRLVTGAALRCVLGRYPKRRGSRALRSLLDAERGPQITRREAARIALKLMRKHGIEPDETEYPIGPYRVDFLFRAERLVVEVDGYQFHSTPQRFVADRRRIATLNAMGFLVHPLTWTDLVDTPEKAMETLRTALLARAAQLTL